MSLRILVDWLWFQAVLDAVMAAVLFAAPGVLLTTGILPEAHLMYVRIIAVVAGGLAVGYGLAARRPEQSTDLLLTASFIRFVMGSALLVSAAPDSSLHPLLRVAGLGELTFAAVTMILQRRAGVSILPEAR